MIRSFFLRASHWQLFLLLFGVFLVGQVAVMSSPLPTVASPEDFWKAGLMFGMVIVLSMFCFFAWLWSMGSFLNSIVHPTLRLKMGFFRFALVYPALYIFAFIAFFLNPNPVLFAVIFPLHFFAMFCMLYNLYFVSKSLVLVETAKPVTFYDYAGPFFLIWFFPIGVWIIQPRISRLYAGSRIAT